MPAGRTSFVVEGIKDWLTYSTWPAGEFLRRLGRSSSVLPPKSMSEWRNPTDRHFTWITADSVFWR
jgi:hypothetical protein